MTNRLFQKKFSPSGGDGRQATIQDRLPESSADAVKSRVKQVEQLIGRYPAAALGVALSLGVLVGWMVKRK